MTTPSTPRLLGATVLRVDRATSTNDLLRELAAQGAREGTVVVAREQSAGRGRRGRAWLSPPGGLWCSLLLRPPDPSDGRIALAAAVGAAEGIRTVCGISVGLKWPNDLMLGRGKVGGILVESVPPAVILGVGINVNVDPATFPARIAGGAASLAAVLHYPVDLEGVLVAVLAGIDAAYGMLRAGRAAELLQRWRRFSVTLGRPVRIDDGAGLVEGLAIDVDADGALLVEATGGKRTRVIAGDVTMLDVGGQR
ncbi:MAG: biotin--[acetyl-CoA-carboxylase] ligase [bacterium]